MNKIDFICNGLKSAKKMSSWRTLDSSFVIVVLCGNILFWPDEIWSKHFILWFSLFYSFWYGDGNIPLWSLCRNWWMKYRLATRCHARNNELLTSCFLQWDHVELSASASATREKMATVSFRLFNMNPQKLCSSRKRDQTHQKARDEKNIYIAHWKLLKNDNNWKKKKKQ